MINLKFNRQNKQQGILHGLLLFNRQNKQQGILHD